MASFWQFLNNDKTVELKGMTEGLVDRFAALSSRGHSAADLIGHYADDFGHLPSERLTELRRAHRRFLTTKKRARQLQQARRAAKLVPLPDAAAVKMTTPHELDAMFRTSRMCSRDSCKSEDEWIRVLVVGADLWRRCVLAAHKGGFVKTSLRDANHAAVGRYDDLVRAKDVLGDIPAHRWLAMRRGQREGVLALELELPREPLLDQLEALRPELGEAAQGREADSLLDELVYDDLPGWLLQILDQRAEMDAIDSAAMALRGLLRSAPLQTRALGAIYLAKRKTAVAAVVADREGELTGQVVVKPEGNWIQKVVEFLKSRHVQHIAVPTSAPDAELLTELDGRLIDAGLSPVKIRVAAIAEARRALTDPPLRLGASVASSLVLARRALDPLKEWSSVDPVSIGVAEYQNDLDTERLRTALKQAVALCRHERRRGKSSYMGAPVTRGASAMARLNPLVKTIADLRGDMTVNGVITNISHFGAFVNIGLAQEGLVHISELSDEYVNDPNEVVRIGQQVNANVLSVDPGRGRISLSLKSTRMQRREGGVGARPGGGGGGPRGDGDGRPKTKAEALASLERLFKK